MTQPEEPDIQIDATLLDIRPYYPEDTSGLMSVRLGSKLERALHEIIDSGQTPYKTKSDIVRTGTFYYTDWLRQAARIRNPVLQRLMLEGRMVVKSADNKRWVENQQETLRNIHELLVSLINMGALDELRSTIGDYYRMVLEIQQPFWRNQYLRAMNDLSSVQLAVAMLHGSGLGVPSEYTKGVNYVSVSGSASGGGDLPTDEGVPTGDSGAEPGLHEQEQPGRSGDGRIETVGGSAEGNPGESGESVGLPALPIYGERDD